MAHHRGHHGYPGPVPTTHHARKHDGQMAAIDREHAARNREGGHSLHLNSSRGVASPPRREKRSDNVVGGSAKTHDIGNKAPGARGGKGGAIAGKKQEMGAIRRAAGGNPDSGPNRSV